MKGDAVIRAKGVATKINGSGGGKLVEGRIAAAIAYAALDAKAAAAVAAVTTACVVTGRRRAWREKGSEETLRES